jgi:archaemetzincin
MEPRPAPKFAFSPYVHQFSAPTIVRKIADTVEEDAVKVLGITAFDLYAPRTNYVFGEAQISGPAAIISLYRLLHSDRGLYLERVGKEALHELGHTLGLDHCPDPACVMHFSHTITDTDEKTSNFCDRDREYLDEVLHRK